MTEHTKTTKSQAMLTLRDNVQALMDRHEWLQEEAGKRLGIQQKAVSRILTLENEARLDTVQTIADKLRLPPALLICDGMDAKTLMLKSQVSGPLVELIEKMIRLEKAGRLPFRVLKVINDTLDLAVPPKDGM
jgi:transcriptional regulator with XRE-family HTH domain